MGKNTLPTLPSGRVRNWNEHLFTVALMDCLDEERELRGMDQRSFANFLRVHESLLSLYRSGHRLPSITGFIELETKLPGLLGRTVRGYYRAQREEEDRKRAAVAALQEEIEEEPSERLLEYQLLGV